MNSKRVLSTTSYCASAMHLLGLLMLVGASTLPGPATAAIYKCVDDSGNTTYAALPCPINESTQLISQSSSAVKQLDCRIGRKLAVDTISRMLDGESSQSVYARHGGMNSISPLVVSLVNYVYTFQGNEDVSFNRIAKLTTRRCQVGSFGPDASSCDLYPYDFLESLGGCEAAASDTSHSQHSPQSAEAMNQNKRNDYYYKKPEDAPSFSAQNSSDYLSLPALGEANSSSNLECRNRLQQTLDATINQMRQLQDAQTQDRLRNRQRQLRSQLAKC